MNGQFSPTRLLKSSNPPSERRWVLGFAIAVMLLTTLPYLLGYAFQGREWAFTGFVFGVEDGNSYIAKMLSGEAGAWVFRTPYTTFPQTGALIFLSYLLLGKLAAPPGLHDQLVVLFHLYRIGAGLLAVLAIYDFLAFFIHDIRLRRLGTALAVLGGGLGWVLVLLNRPTWLGTLPLEFYSPETFGFLALYGVPHLALARALLLWGLRAYLIQVRKILDQGTSQPSTSDRVPIRESIKTGLLWLLTGLAQPLIGMVVGAVVGLHLAALAGWQIYRTARREPSAWPKVGRIARFALLAGSLPAPLVIYNILSFGLDPFQKVWASQSPLPSPHPLHYLLAYGLLLPLVVFGARRLINVKPWEGWLLVAWVLALPLLAYAPFNMQRRLPEGMWVALVALAAAAVDGRLKRDQSPVPLLPILFAFPSTLLLLVGGVLAAARPSLPVFRPRQEIAAFEYLQAKARPFEVVLSSYETGNALPAWAPLRVVIGHGPESAGLANLRPQVTAFYSSGAPDSTRLELLRDFNVHYVIWGPDERALGDWDAAQASFLLPVYQYGAYEVFEFRPGP